MICARTAVPLVLFATVPLLFAVARALEADQTRDATYWIERMEAALLPQSSLRTEASITTTTRGGIERTTLLQLARVLGPERLRTLVTITEESEPVYIERIVSREGSRKLDRRVFRTVDGSPLRQPVSGGHHIGDTEFTYDDLGFVDFAPREKATVEPGLPRDGQETVKVTSEGYAGYGKIVTLLAADTALPLEVRYYDEAGRWVRTLRFGGFDREGPYTFPTRAEVEDRDDGRTSKLRFFETRLGPPIFESEFSTVEIQKRLRVLRAETDRALL